jgi:prepilin-type processing-associated H-X9-DG protein
VLPLLAEGRRVNKRYQDLAGRIDRAKAWDDPANAAVLNIPVRAFLCPGHPDFEPNRAPGLTHYVGLAGIGPRAAFLDRSDPRAGMFGHGRGVRPREIAAGISHTMMVLETADENGPWLAGGFPTVRDLAPDVDDYIGPGRPFGGMHAGIMNVLWVDGSVRAVADDTPGDLLRRQATIRREADDRGAR